MRPTLAPRRTARHSAVLAVAEPYQLLTLADRARTAVSLHCHSEHSKETLEFLPHYAARLPVVAKLFEVECRRNAARYGGPLDFTKAWWTPPVSPRAVYEAEARQIRERLGLRPLVSITDHDDIAATVHLQVLDWPERVPVSMEWTVPFGVAYFHVGVHNLPAERAYDISAALLDYTANPRKGHLAELLSMLDETHGVLVVLNHPFWDIECVTRERHDAALLEFVARYGRWIHAFEVNGFRPWKENLETIAFARELGMPLVSGGDRHGCQANTALNVTGAATFDEFADEVRDGKSEVVLLPAYREPMAARTLEAVGEVLRDYPTHPVSRQRWTERVFVRMGTGEALPLAHFWPHGGPAWARWAARALCLLGSPRFRPALRLALSSEGMPL